MGFVCLCLGTQTSLGTLRLAWEKALAGFTAPPVGGHGEERSSLWKVEGPG